jgi:hypothetical protein
MTPRAHPPGTAAVLAQLFLKSLSGEKVCSWALSALEAGYDSESLRILAAMSLEALPVYSEAELWFLRCLTELQIAVPEERDVVLRAYVAEIAEDLASGRAAVDEALDTIHSCVVSPLGHPQDLMGWCFLWEGNTANGEGELPDSQREMAVRKFAREWLSGSAHAA